MEDSHIVATNIADNTHVFGVFDGHGGRNLIIFIDFGKLGKNCKTEKIVKKRVRQD